MIYVLGMKIVENIYLVLFFKFIVIYLFNILRFGEKDR